MFDKAIVVERYKVEGSNGKWYYPHAGLPTGVKWTGEKKSVGYSIKNNGCYISLDPTREEAEAKLKRWKEGNIS